MFSKFINKENRETAIYISLFFIFAGVTLGALFNFNSYIPKASNDKKEVKGSQSFFPSIPSTVDAKEINKSETFTTKNISFETTDSTEKIVNFYRNVFEDTKWKLENVSTEDNTTLITYENNGKYIYVNIESSDNIRKVSIDTVI